MQNVNVMFIEISYKFHRIPDTQSRVLTSLRLSGTTLVHSWNELPYSTRNAISISAFKRSLNSTLIGISLSQGGAIVGPRGII